MTLSVTGIDGHINGELVSGVWGMLISGSFRD